MNESKSLSFNGYVRINVSLDSLLKNIFFILLFRLFVVVVLKVKTTVVSKIVFEKNYKVIQQKTTKKNEI